MAEFCGFWPIAIRVDLAEGGLDRTVGVGLGGRVVAIENYGAGRVGLPPQRGILSQPSATPWELDTEKE